MQRSPPLTLLSRIQKSLLLKILVPTILLVMALSLAAAQVLAFIIRRTHEENAERRARNVGDVVEEVINSQMAGGHPNLAEELLVLCRTSGKSAFVTTRDGRVRYSCDPTLAGTTILVGQAPNVPVIHGGAPWVRHQRPLRGTPACSQCHEGARPLGYLVIDSPLSEAENEVRQQQRMNLVAGFAMAISLSILLAVVQVVLVHRPVRSLTIAVERIRSGDLAARAPDSGRGDEIGVLARSLNAMAACIEHATAELDRTYRAGLAQAEKLASLGQLTTSIAHEIKNPLSGIIGALRVLEADAADSDPNKAILGKLLAQTDRLAKTAVELLEFARPLRPTIDEVDPADLLDRTIFFVERQALAQKVELRRLYASGLPKICVDPDLIREVFLNLLLNGIQAMPQGGTLEVDARRVGGNALEFLFRDQGVGIPQEHMNRIFSPFFSTKASGTGLGLYVARQIVEMQRGEIRVESRVMQGSAFTVRFHVAHPDQVSDATS